MHGDKIKKQEEEENEEEKEKEEEREREESEEQGEEQEDGKGEEDRPYQQRQPIPYCIASRDSRSERHLQHLRVDATRSVFPWQPSTPSPLDQTPPGSPAELPIEAPVESKSGWPVEVRDSEDTDSSQPQTNDADLSYSTDPFSTITGAPRSIISTSLPNPEPKPSRPSSRLDLNNTSVGLYLCGSAMNGYPFSGRGQNDGFCIWSGPLADCPRAFNISLWLDDEWDEDDDDGDENRNQLPGTYCNIDKSDGGGPWYRIRRWIHDDDKRVRSLIIESMKPVWPWEPLTPLYTPRGSHSGWTPEPPPVGMKNGYTVGCWSNYPDGFWGTPPVGAPGGLRADSPVGYRSRPRAWST